MTKFQRSMVILNALWFVVVMALVFYSESEYSKRIELEGQIDNLASTIDSIATLTMKTRHTMPDCYSYQSEMSFVLADYYKYRGEVPPIDSSGMTGQSEPEMKLVEDYMWIVLDTTALINRIKQQVLDSIREAK